MTQYVLMVVLALMLGLCLLTTIRVADGRASFPDRLLAGDLTIALLTFVLAVLSALSGSEVYMDAALVAALLAFVATVALARFITEGKVF